MKKIIIALLIGISGFLIAITVFTAKEATLIGLIAFLVTLWTNEGLPLGAVSLLPIVLFPAFDILSTNETSVNYSKSVIFLFLGGFLLAISVEKTGLHKVITHKMLSIFPSTVRGIIFSLAITSGLLSSFLSNTTTTLLLMPLALFLSEDSRIKMRFALAIAYGASIGGIITPIGTPPNLILMGFMDDKGLKIIPFMQWVWMVIPLAILMFVIVSYILSLGVSEVKIDRDKTTNSISPIMNSEQKKVSFCLLALMLLLFLNAPIKPYYNGFGLNEKGILLSFGLLMFLPPVNVLTWQDTKKIPYEIIFLFGAGFSIATAFTVSGLANSVASYLLELTTFPPVLIMLSIAAIVTFTTEVTSNTALISMMLPILYAVTETSGLDTRLFLMVATICASYAFMLPIATPPNAIAMSSGVIKVGTMAKYGFLFNIIGIFLIVIMASVLWSNFI
ncbi:MAG: DASS family sodium-coupled anion symporter [gamma proteobacterium symbiont of Lucinoma myriamae]|nr:DASS family sodium-coupled anion symporter [gamma proteobacterium symbiont of Lucinoma myriamae]MCU7819674.1 DASS family sodium-coupled anion symporter [gamma proteobacterium symbiont of Lucinoma myriamae]